MRDKWIPTINGKRHMAVPSIGRYVPLNVFITAVKEAKANPDEEFKHGLMSWDSTTGRQIREQFRYQIRDRINQAIPYHQR